MTDPRVEKLASVLVHYSLELQRGQLVRIRGSALAAPQILALYRTALEAGAHPVVRAGIDGI